MDRVVIASSEADARAADAVVQHHAHMAGELTARVEALVAAAAAGDTDRAAAASDELTHWCSRELVPHAVAEETAMYPAAQGMSEGRLLVAGMLAEHTVITGLVDQLVDAAEPVRAATAASALKAVFDSHLTKENDLVLPLLVGAPDVSVAALLDGMHEALGGSRESRAVEAGACRGTCGCGEVDAPGYPELDARAVPHAIRHATIFGALDAVQPGGGMVLVAPHDPLPLLAQVEERSPGRFAVSYLERGPESWRLQFVRRAAA